MRKGKGVKQRCELEKVSSKKRRLEGGGRKPLFLEDQLQAWMESLKENNPCYKIQHYE